MSITKQNGYLIVDFNVNSICGTPSLGGYLLKFSVNYSMPAYDIDEEVYFHKTLAKVYVGKNNCYLGLAIPEQSKTFKPTSHPYKAGLMYEIIISNDSMEEIEKLRAGNDLEFRLDISGEINDGNCQSNNAETVRYTANQKEWIMALKSMGFKGGVVFELPMDINPSDEVASALVSIKKAKEHLYYGNYDDVISKCRISLESIIKSWGKMQSIKGIQGKGRKKMSKEQRFFNSIDQIVHFTHLAHHPDENNEYISFTRGEAVFVLGATIAAVSSYVESKI